LYSQNSQWYWSIQIINWFDCAFLIVCLFILMVTRIKKKVNNCSNTRRCLTSINHSVRPAICGLLKWKLSFGIQDVLLKFLFWCGIWLPKFWYQLLLIIQKTILVLFQTFNSSIKFKNVSLVRECENHHSTKIKSRWIISRCFKILIRWGKGKRNCYCAVFSIWKSSLRKVQSHFLWFRKQISTVTKKKYHRTLQLA
jgi:diacylglycerol kinase